ncbi:hypothetical protein SZ63_01630 [Methanoculleus sediminis]|uniref:Uncharacterized protein n=1 Tax=Methanoculleus sediminis TaxID=1550566 RepID=A0A0H1R201_9EURY|nr:hypothetical protein [Methanoculleus sediminis]KLK89168.1 hypothetical protein SZ63_01630 [Methanoculleus sediminis]
MAPRLCGLAIGGDGSPLVGDDTNGVIYRASCAGANNTTGDWCTRGSGAGFPLPRLTAAPGRRLLP